MTSDPWGITQIHPTKSGGREWFSNWHTASTHSWDSKGTDTRSPDPNDSSVDLHCQDSQDGIKNSAAVDGSNDLIELSGRTPRLYINDSAGSLFWQNVESTVYARGLSTLEGGGAYVICRVAVRSNHHKEYQCVSSGGGYAFEVKLNGTLQLRKELVHPAYADDVPAQISSLGLNQWIGIKTIIRNNPNYTLLRGYIDLTDGAGGGTWQPVAEKLDKGDWAVTDCVDVSDFNSANSGSVVCTKPTSLTSILFDPRVSCYFRCDNVRTQLKKASVREVDPIP